MGKVLICSLSSGNNCCLMSLQDVPVHNSTIKARVMFDNGSEITLVSNFFAKKNNLPYEQATYTLAGLGSEATTFDSNNNGKIYTVPLEDSNGEIVLVKAFAVEKILKERIGRDEVKLNQEDFPHLSEDVLQEAVKPLPRKYLDILIGNPDLALQPVCQSGFGCQDCAKGRCLYRSRFGSGYVPLGSFEKAIAIEKAPETYEDVAKDLNISVHEVKDDSKKLLEDTYVDDGTTEGSKKEVDRMIGVKLPDGSFSGTIPSIMKKDVDTFFKTSQTRKSLL